VRDIAQLRLFAAALTLAAGRGGDCRIGGAN
jgi:hypothetical protein